MSVVGPTLRQRFKAPEQDSLDTEIVTEESQDFEMVYTLTQTVVYKNPIIVIH